MHFFPNFSQDISFLSLFLFKFNYDTCSKIALKLKVLEDTEIVIHFIKKKLIVCYVSGTGINLIRHSPSPQPASTGESKQVNS